tara:strand:+ start:6008 stop:6331 length:324 start_codon:yes stop_codon:yes gene_type:complete
MLTHVYQFQDKPVQIPEDNVMRVDKIRYDWALDFLDKQKELEKQIDKGLVGYLQSKQVVVLGILENTENNKNSKNINYTISFSDDLNPEIISGLLEILEEGEGDSIT